MSAFFEIRLKAKEALFKAGEPADKLYFIQSGSIEINDPITGAVFATLSDGDSFGEQAMLQGGVRSASAVAKNDTVLLEVTADDLKRLLKTASPILTAVFEGLLLQQNMHNALQLKT